MVDVDLWTEKPSITRSFLFPRHCLISDLDYNRILRWIWMFLSEVIHSVAISNVFSLDLPALYSNGVTWSWSAVSKPVLSSRGSINATGLQFGFVWCFSCDTEVAALITWRWLQCKLTTFTRTSRKKVAKCEHLVSVWSPELTNHIQEFQRNVFPPLTPTDLCRVTWLTHLWIISVTILSKLNKDMQDIILKKDQI